MKKRSFLLLPLAAALALTGCSGSANETPGSPDAGASQEKAAPETAALSTEQATAIVKKLAGDSADAQIMDGDTIAAALPQAKKLIEQMEISPEKCAEFVSQQAAWDIDGINMAVAVLMDDSTMESTSYSVAGYEDTAKLDQITKQVKNKDLQGCDKIGMTVQGQNAEVGVKILDASSDADLTYATSNTTKLNGTDVPGGGSYQMQGLVGNNAVSVSMTGTDAESEADVLKKLTEELNKAVAEVKATAK